MTEEHVVDELHDYHDGVLTSEQRERVDRHIAQCVRCREALEQLRIVQSTAKDVPRAIEPTRDLWPAIEGRLSPRIGQTSQGAASELRVGTSRVVKPVWHRWQYRAAAILVIALLGSLSLWYFTKSSPAWRVERVNGMPFIDGGAMAEVGQLHVGDWLDTDSRSRARIMVGQIGNVEVEPNSRLHLVDASASNHRLAMPRGTIHARISAPPRLFFVETPAALAVDLGCVYTMSVDSNGSGMLRVEAGWVSLEYQKRESIVPGGAVCYTRPGFGPGTPFFPDASRVLQSALQRLDFGGASEHALSTVLSHARGTDAITLWHLLFRVGPSDKGRVYDRLTALVPPPAVATRPGVLAGNPEMLEAWQRKLNLGAKDWWEVWK